LTPSYRAYLSIALAVLVFAFAAFHPCFDAAGFCGLGECPDASKSSEASHTAGFPTDCVAAVLLFVLATAAFAAFSGRRAANHRRPAAAFLSPDTPPPRVLPGR
jgi:hypothetical protein